MACTIGCLFGLIAYMTDSLCFCLSFSIFYFFFLSCLSSLAFYFMDSFYIFTIFSFSQLFTVARSLSYRFCYLTRAEYYCEASSLWAWLMLLLSWVLWLLYWANLQAKGNILSYLPLLFISNSSCSFLKSAIYRFLNLHFYLRVILVSSLNFLSKYSCLSFFIFLSKVRPKS